MPSAARVCHVVAVTPATSAGLLQGRRRGRRVLLAAALLLAGAAGGPGPEIRPARAGNPTAFEQRARAVVDAELHSFRSRSGPGCVASVQRGGRTLALGAGGLASLEYQVPLSSHTPLAVGSIAKQFLAAMAFMLHDQARLDLDAPVTHLVPELPPRFRPVTGRHLLTHTSGLRDYLQGAHHAGAGLHEPLSHEETLAFLVRQSGLDFPPGTDASYSNSNYFLLSTMIERAEGRTIGEVARRLIFEPLGMSSSRFLTDGLEVVPGRARAYRESADGAHRLHEPVTGTGGMITTLDDLLLWTRHLGDMRAKNEPLLTKLTTPARLRDGRPTKEAAGLRVDRRFNRRVIEHNGSNRGFNAYLGWYPDEPDTDVWIAVLCNVRQAGATSLAHGIASALFDAAPPPRAAYPELGARVLERLARYAGVYEAAHGPGALEIEIDAPHAIVTLYGVHPSDSRTASNLLEPPGKSGVFTLSGLSPRARLVLDEDDSIPAAVFEMDGRARRRFVKVAPPGQDDLELVVGRFRSDDLNVIYALFLREGSLALTIVRPGGSEVDRGPLTTVTRDLHVIRNDPVTHIHLRRDARDRVIGFELNEPRLRGVSFRRIDAGAASGRGGPAPSGPPGS